MVPCHHGTEGPQAADKGTATSTVGGCENIEYAEADSRQGVVVQLGG